MSDVRPLVRLRRDCACGGRHRIRLADGTVDQPARGRLRHAPGYQFGHNQIWRLALRELPTEPGRDIHAARQLRPIPKDRKARRNRTSTQSPGDRRSGVAAASYDDVAGHVGDDRMEVAVNGAQEQRQFGPARQPKHAEARGIDRALRRHPLQRGREILERDVGESSRQARCTEVREREHRVAMRGEPASRSERRRNTSARSAEYEERRMRAGPGGLVERPDETIVAHWGDPHTGCNRATANPGRRQLTAPPISAVSVQESAVTAVLPSSDRPVSSGLTRDADQKSPIGSTSL